MLVELEAPFAPRPVNVSLMSQPPFWAKNVLETMPNLNSANLTNAADPWVFPEPQDPKVSPEMMVFLDHKAFLDQMESRDNKDPKVPVDTKDHKERLDPKVTQESKVFLVPKDPLVLKDPEDVKVHKVTLDLLDQPVLEALPAKMEEEDPSVPVVPMDKMESLEKKVPLAPWDHKAFKEFPENLDPVVFPDLKVDLVLVANLPFLSLCLQKKWLNWLNLKMAHLMPEK